MRRGALCVGRKNGKGIDRVGDLHEIKREEGIDIRGSEEALVAVAVKTVVGIVVAGCIVAAADTVAIITC